MAMGVHAFGLLCVFLGACAVSSPGDAGDSAEAVELRVPHRTIALAPTATHDALAARLFDALARMAVADGSLGIVSTAKATSVSGRDDSARTSTLRSLHCGVATHGATTTHQCSLLDFEADGSLPATLSADSLAAKLFFALIPDDAAPPYGRRTLMGEGGTLSCTSNVFAGFACTFTHD